MSRNLARPYFPLPPQEYSPQYMAEVVRSFSNYIEQQGNPGLGRFTSATMTGMPTSTTGLEDGALWNDAGTVRLWSTGWTAPAYTTITGTDITNWNTAYGWGDHGAAGYLEAANNLSDVANAATSRTNLGVGTGDSPSFTGLAVTGTALDFGSDNVNRELTISGARAVLGYAGSEVYVEGGTTKGVGLRVNGSATSTLAISSAGVTTVTGDLTVDTDTLHVDSTNNRVGIGTSSPSANNLELAHATTPSMYLTDTGGGQAEVASYNGNLVLGADRDGTQGGGSILFRSTGTAQSMQINSSGDVLVGTTSTSGIFNGSSTNPGIRLSSSGGIDIQKNDNTTVFMSKASGYSSGVYVSFYVAGSSVGSISTNGTTTAYTTTSDYRLKDDVQPMLGASERIMGLNPVNFAWKVDGSRTDGFIAHEVQAIAPYAVTGEKDGEEMQQMDHSKLVPLLTAALQEALQRIEALEALVNVKTEG